MDKWSLGRLLGILAYHLFLPCWRCIPLLSCPAADSAKERTANLTLKEPNMQKPIEGQIVISVDTHKEIHVAAAVNWQGTLDDERSFATTRQGYRQLESWVRSLGNVLRVGVKCSESYGSGLTRHLIKNGFTVLGVTFLGMTYRHRLNRGGDHQANSAIHIIAIGRLRTDQKCRTTLSRSWRKGIQRWRRCDV